MLVTSIARSGINAALARLNASASNVANVRSTGDPETGEGAYRPVRVRQSEAVGGGVTLTSERVQRSNPPAEAAEQAALPSVDLVNEAIEQMIAKQDAQANVAVLRTAFDMQAWSIERFG